jgi:hypothetical protein
MGMDARYSMTYDKRSYNANHAAYRLTSAAMTDIKRGRVAGGGFTAANRAEAMGETTNTTPNTTPNKKRTRGA